MNTQISKDQNKKKIAYTSYQIEIVNILQIFHSRTAFHP